MDPWVVGSGPSERYPLWTRANVGEVFPDPVAPLSFTLAMVEHAEMGWRDAWVRMGAFTDDEFAPDDMETIGVFGSYCYLNASVCRIFGERAPGLSAEAVDELFFGAQPGIPPYTAQPGDRDEERTAAVGETFGWVLSSPLLDEVLADEALVDDLRHRRPDLEAMEDAELWARARDLFQAHFRRLFGRHIFITFLATVPVGIVGQVCAAVGRPEAALRLVSGLGDVESAAPSLAMWRLSRLVRAEAALQDAFDAGVPGLLGRLEALGGPAAAFLAGFRDLLDDYGMRGPNEWEMSIDTWETRPELALAAIDRMRLAPDEASPEERHDELAAERERLTGEIAALLTGDPEAHGTFLAAVRAAQVFQAGRERTKTNGVKQVHEARMPMRVLAARMVARGALEEPGDFGLLRLDEVDAWLADPLPFRSVLAARRTLMAEYAARREPFVFEGAPPPPESWPWRADERAEPAQAGDVLTGLAGCAGVARGVARVVLDAGDPGALGPGDVLVAPATDPSWTPLFVPAAAVVVDVGAAQSHAMIVCRELGIPCVASVTGATRRIPDGALVEVDGDRGVVTVLALP